MSYRMDYMHGINSIGHVRDIGKEWSEIKREPILGRFLFLTLGLFDFKTFDQTKITKKNYNMEEIGMLLI